jgi:hypothetical protein
LSDDEDDVEDEDEIDDELPLLLLEPFAGVVAGGDGVASLSTLFALKTQRVHLIEPHLKLKEKKGCFENYLRCELVLLDEAAAAAAAAAATAAFMCEEYLEYNCPFEFMPKLLP